ncbi:MAG: sulfite exporter TauE/SafE family protein [Planctomycetota bacterium]
MIALVTAVFLASVLGSLHCVGMCGAFLAVAFTDVPTTGRWRLSAAYHGGRLLTYTALGIAAGTAGSLLDLGGTLAGISRVALPLAGTTIIVFGVIGLLRQAGVSVRRLRLPAAWTTRVHRLQNLAMRMPPARRALAIGLLTTLLPCGWLYAFAATAAGTASPVWGGLVMAVFWSGTLPALASFGLGIQALAGPLGRRLPAATCLVLIGFGTWAVAGRAQFDIPTMTSHAWAASEQAPVPSAAAPCHDTPKASVEFDPVTGLIIENPAHQCRSRRADEVSP